MGRQAPGRRAGRAVTLDRSAILTIAMRPSTRPDEGIHGCSRAAPLRSALIRGLAVIAFAIVSSGCVSSIQLAPTQPAATAQLLVIRALERALVQLDTARFRGRAVAVELFTQLAQQPAATPQAGSHGFVEEFVTAWLRARGVRVASDSAELRLKIFASALGTDRGETFVGIPSIQTPLLNIPTPEISVFKWVRNRGLAEISVYTFDAKNDAFVDVLGPAVGRSKQDDFTVLIVIAFTVSDVERRPAPPR
jgi:hypothetical protein